MKIILTAVGSTGDIEPFIPLSIGLQQRGHNVLMCSNDVYEEKFTSRGIEFNAIGPPIDLEEMRKAREHLEHLSPLKQLDFLVENVFLNEGKKYFDDCLRSNEGYDLGICHSLDFLGQHALIERNIPWISVVLCPGIVPTSFNSPMHLPNLGKMLNPLLWRLFNFVKRPSERKIEGYLSKLNGIKRKISITGTFSPYLNIVASCSAFNTLPPDVDKTFIQTGNLSTFTNIDNYQAPTDLMEFIQDKRPEVVFTFGSMGGSDGEAIAELFCAVTRSLSMNAIIVKGWGNIESDQKTGDIFYVDFIPYEYLFEHVNIVVHHGGAGTCYMAAKSGKTSIIIPHLADQQYWGNELNRIGIAGRSILKKNLSVKNLSAEIDRVRKDQKLGKNAIKIRNQILSENGVDNAIRIIEKFVSEKIKID